MMKVSTRIFVAQGCRSAESTSVVVKWVFLRKAMSAKSALMRVAMQVWLEEKEGTLRKIETFCVAAWEHPSEEAVRRLLGAIEEELIASGLRLPLGAVQTTKL